MNSQTGIAASPELLNFFGTCRSGKFRLIKVMQMWLVILLTNSLNWLLVRCPSMMKTPRPWSLTRATRLAGPGRRTGKPRCNPTCPAAAQLPFLQKFHPQPYGCLPGILTPWNLEILKIPPTREKLILRMYKVKVAVVGPSQAGKTMISNFLADATENIGGEIGFCFCFM